MPHEIFETATTQQQNESSQDGFQYILVTPEQFQQQSQNGLIESPIEESQPLPPSPFPLPPSPFSFTQSPGQFQQHTQIEMSLEQSPIPSPQLTPSPMFQPQTPDYSPPWSPMLAQQSPEESPPATYTETQEQLENEESINTIPRPIQASKMRQAMLTKANRTFDAISKAVQDIAAQNNRLDYAHNIFYDFLKTIIPTLNPNQFSEFVDRVIASYVNVKNI